MGKVKDDNRFYVYEWYNVDTGEVFYVGKGTGYRYKNTKDRNIYFKRYYNKHKKVCKVRFLEDNIPESYAFFLEEDRIAELRNIGQAKCNLSDGGEGSTFYSLGECGKEIYYAILDIRKVNGSHQFRLPSYKRKALIRCMEEYDIGNHKDVFEMSMEEREEFYHNYMEMIEEEMDEECGYKLFCEVILDCYDSMDEYWESLI